MNKKNKTRMKEVVRLRKNEKRKKTMKSILQSSPDAKAIPDEVTSSFLYTKEEVELRLRTLSYNEMDIIWGRLKRFQYNGQDMFSKSEVCSIMQSEEEKDASYILLDILPYPIPEQCKFSLYELLGWFKATGIPLEDVLDWLCCYQADDVSQIWSYIEAPAKDYTVYNAIVQYLNK